MAGDPHDHHEYHKDLRHASWEEVYGRQEKRASLADAYWDLADGRPGFRVADVGCGPGYFTRRYAAMTGPTGHVHAVDIAHEAIEYLRKMLDPIHDAHVTTEVLDVEEAPLPALHFDAIFCTDMLHHADDVPAILRNLRLAGTPLVIAEFDPAGPGDMGPPLSERIAPARMMELLRDAGWKVRAWQALAHEHYAVVAAP